MVCVLPDPVCPSVQGESRQGLALAARDYIETMQTRTCENGAVKALGEALEHALLGQRKQVVL